MFRCGSVTLQCCRHPVCARHRCISARACFPSISDIGSCFPIYIEWEPLSVLGSDLKREFKTRWVLRKNVRNAYFHLPSYSWVSHAHKALRQQRSFSSRQEFGWNHDTDPFPGDTASPSLHRFRDREGKRDRFSRCLAAAEILGAEPGNLTCQQNRSVAAAQVTFACSLLRRRLKIKRHGAGKTDVMSENRTEWIMGKKGSETKAAASCVFGFVFLLFFFTWQGPL